MANTIVLPYPTIPRTCKRHQWRRYTTTAMTINKTSKHSSSYIVHNSAPNLPDIVNDCHNRRNDVIILNAEMKSMCKEIAHSLRIVADQVDKKYCQDGDCYLDLHCLTIRLVLQTTQIRTIVYTIWTRAFLPFFLLIYKTKSLF